VLETTVLSSTYYCVFLVGIVTTVLAIAPKVRGLKPGRG
jgi:hypothetical protein